MGERTKILIVDDTLDTVELLKKRFRAEGYQTVEAYDGEQGLARVHEENPDLVILDVMMPKLDGFAVCERLRHDETTRYLPVLMLTAKTGIPERIKGLDCGADDYLAKPFDYKELSARVRSLLAKKEASRQLAEREKTDALDHLVDEVSHEVRNPLVAIGGFARRVYKNLSEGDENRRYLKIILDNVVALEKMITELVELKATALSFQEATDINVILRDTLSLFSEEIGARHIELSTDFMDNPPPIPADRENLARALFNIIENAIEAMERPPRSLAITSAVDNGFFTIRVSDTGKGISRERLKNIYDPFFTSKTKGPGLGLTFALKTVQAHSGTIAVESEEGKGSTFLIKLPLPIGS
jgi:two-component system sensor histidine kinase/response regulator